MTYNYGALRVVRVRPPANATADLQERYPTGWLPEKQLVHLLMCCETTIGRALTNDIVLFDLTVSREHARLVHDEHGWRVFNLTVQNVVRVNGRPVPSGGSLPIHPQDLMVLGSTIMQLIAPQPDASDASTFDLDGPTQRIFASRDIVASASPPVLYNGFSRNGQRRYDSAAAEQKKAPTSLQPQEAMQERTWQRPTPPPLDIPLLPVQPEPELAAQTWEDSEESLLGAGITMQFALPQRMGKHTRWLIAGISITILAVSAITTIVLSSLIGISALAQNGPSSVLAALTIPLIPAFGINLLVNFIDRFEREPWFLRLAAFLWGAIIAIPPASVIEQSIDALMQHVLGPSASSLVSTAFTRAKCRGY